MEGLFCKEGRSVLLMSDMFLYHILLHTLSFLDVLSNCLKDAVHLQLNSHVLGNGTSGALVLHLTKEFFVCHAVEHLSIQMYHRGVSALSCPCTHLQSG